MIFIPSIQFYKATETIHNCELIVSNLAIIIGTTKSVTYFCEIIEVKKAELKLSSVQHKQFLPILVR